MHTYYIRLNRLIIFIKKRLPNQLSSTYQILAFNVVILLLLDDIVHGLLLMGLVLNKIYRHFPPGR